MQFKKKLSSLLALVLVFAMLLSTVAFAKTPSGLTGTDKVKVELVYMTSGGNINGLPYTVADAKTDMEVGNKFYIGLRVIGLKNFVDASAGLLNCSFKVKYNADYVTVEPSASNASKVKQAVTNRMKPYTLYNSGGDWSPNYDYTIDQAGRSGTGANAMFTYALAWGDMADPECAAANPDFKGTETNELYLGVWECEVKAVPTNGAKVFNFVLDNATTFTFGPSGDPDQMVSYLCSADNPAEELSDVAEFDDSKVNIFPAGQPTLGGSATIVNNDGSALGTTLVTGTTVKVDTSAVTVSDSSTPTFSYQWMRSGSTTPIGTGATYTTVAADVGKTITCVVTATGCKGSVTTAPTPAVTKPALSGTVSITGTPKYGEVLTAGISGGNSASAGTLTYAWKVGGTPVTTGANGNKYTIQKGDIGKTVTCEVTGANTTGPIASTPTAAVAKADLTVPSTVKLDAGTVKVGATGNDAKKTLSDTFAGVNNDTITYSVDVTFTDTSAATDTATITVGTPTYKIGNADATQYYNITGFPTTAIGKVKAKSLTGWTVTAPTKTSYEDGVAIDLTGLKITASYDDGTTENPTPTSVKVNGTAITSGTTPAALAMNGKDIVVEYNGQTKNAGKLTVTPKTSVDVTVAVTGSITKAYDNTTAVKLPAGVTITYTAPTGYTVDDSAAVYTYADATVGTGKAISVSGLKFTGSAAATKVNVTNANALTGDITAVKPTITLGNLNQNTGSGITEVTATGAPASAEAGDKLVVEYEIPGTPKVDAKPCSKPTEHTDDTMHDATCGWAAEVPAGAPTWETWDTAGAKLKALTDTTEINVRAYAPATGTVNYLAGSDADATTGVLKLTKSTGGGGGAVSSNYTVTFNVGAYGTLDGDAKATVKRGETISGLPAVTPNAGYIFCGWTTDGKTVVDPTTVKITKSTTFTALFIAPYISGYPDSTFRPDAQVTRAEIASMLARLNKDFKADATYTGTATDVASGAWYSNYVNFGMSKGFITGHQDGRFAPDANITRGEFASMLARYMGLSNGTKQFTDTADHWANGAIAALADAGIVTGYNDGSFLPNGKLTRAEAVQMINTALKVQALSAEPYVEPTDVAAAHWAYNQILAAMNTDIKDIVK